MGKDWKIRTVMPADTAFIYRTWMESHANAGFARGVRKSVYFKEFRPIVDLILLNSAVKVACKLDDENVIFGYLVFEPMIMHYCYVKEAFRFSGIAKSLVQEAFGGQYCKYYTHTTKYVEPIVDKYPLLTYNPFILFEKYREE